MLFSRTHKDSMHKRLLFCLLAFCIGAGMAIDAKPKNKHKKHTAPNSTKKVAKKTKKRKKRPKQAVAASYTNAPSSVKIDGHTIELTNQDKVYFPKSCIAKGELIAYYKAIAPFMLPYTKNRAISMQRFPDGITKEGFFQKNASDYFPDWITTIPIKNHGDSTVKYVVINDKATLVYLANQGNITPHTWLSKTDKIDYPDRIIFDLDPAGNASFKDVQWAASALKTFLEDTLNLPTFVMLTGSRGAHVIVPLKPKQTFDEVRTFALDCAQVLTEQSPNKVTVAMNKSDRGNKIFIDWLRNGFGATGVTPYAVRAKEGAPVATPLTWNDFLHATSSQQYTIRTIFAYLDTHSNPWENLKKQAVSLTKARKKLDTILSAIKKP